jgi:serine protease Do
MHDYQPTQPSPFLQRRPPSRWPFTILLMTGMTLIALLVGLYMTPSLITRWRHDEAQAAADAAYLKRQAELKAESEAAAKNLETLDKRARLVSLGFREVARVVAPFVVNLTNEVEDGPHLKEKGRLFYDHDENKVYRERTEGSGILVKPGYVLTNYHVVQNAERVRVTFASGRWLKAGPKDILKDPLTDLAVVRLPAEPGPIFKPDYAQVAVFADSDKDVQVGDWVLAAGSPFGLKQTMTAGIVSAKGRVELGILDLVELLQTDTAINPGNSGGPLVDLHGRVVGINTFILTDNGRSMGPLGAIPSNAGVGFAIPSNTAKEIFDILVEKGEVVRGYLGILMQEVPPGVEHKLKIADTGGVYVLHVEPDSPAGRAGLRRNDVIVRYNDEPVGTVNAQNQLRLRIARTEPGTTVPLEVKRQNERLKLQVTIARRPHPPEK